MRGRHYSWGTVEGEYGGASVLRPAGSPGRLQVNRTQLVTWGRALVSEVLGVKGGVLGLQTARRQVCTGSSLTLTGPPRPPSGEPTSLRFPEPATDVGADTSARPEGGDARPALRGLPGPLPPEPGPAWGTRSSQPQVRDEADSQVLPRPGPQHPDLSPSLFPPTLLTAVTSRTRPRLLEPKVVPGPASWS